MSSQNEIMDPEVEREMELLEGEECVAAEEMTAQMVLLQKQLDQLRFKLIKARAENQSLDTLYKPEQFYSKELSAEKLNTLTQGRTSAFLNYCTLQDALRGSQSVEALKAGLELLDDGNKEEMRLEPEERSYVLELMEEEKQLSKELTEKSRICTEQEFQIIQLRRDVADNLCRISELWGKINESDPNYVIKDSELQKKLKVEEAKLNQMRLIIQRLMIGEKNLAQIFDPETNTKFKDMFYKCGLKPDELREETVDLTPNSA